MRWVVWRGDPLHIEADKIRRRKWKMKEKVSFDGIGEKLVTFYAGEDVKVGQVVKVSEDSTVGPCADGDKFCGVAVNLRGGCAGVQMEGFAQVTCEDTAVTVGYVTLAADGKGGVKKADAGKEYLVAAVEDTGVITIKM
jgi:hypothetical protein